MSDPKIIQYIEELDVLIIDDGGKLYHITGDVIAGVWKAYADGHGIDYDICEGYECVDPETAKAEQKHGRWDMSTGVAVCTACGQAPREFYIDNSEKWPFCPLCGAKMEEVEE